MTLACHASAPSLMCHPSSQAGKGPVAEACCGRRGPSRECLLPSDASVPGQASERPLSKQTWQSQPCASVCMYVVSWPSPVRRIRNASHRARAAAAPRRITILRPRRRDGPGGLAVCFFPFLSSCVCPLLPLPSLFQAFPFSAGPSWSWQIPSASSFIITSHLVGVCCPCFFPASTRLLSVFLFSSRWFSSRLLCVSSLHSLLFCVTATLPLTHGDITAIVARLSTLPQRSTSTTLRGRLCEALALPSLPFHLYFFPLPP